MLTKSQFFALLNDADNKIGATAHIAIVGNKNGSASLIIKQNGAPNSWLSDHRYSSTTEAAFTKYNAWLNEWLLGQSASAGEVEAAHDEALKINDAFTVDKSSHKKSESTMKRTLTIFAAAILSITAAHATTYAESIRVTGGGNLQTNLNQLNGQVSGLGADVARIDARNSQQDKDIHDTYVLANTKYTEAAGKALEGEVRNNKRDQAVTDRAQDQLVAQLHADTEQKLAGKVALSDFKADQARQDAAAASEQSARKQADSALQDDIGKRVTTADFQDDQQRQDDALNATAADLDSRIETSKADQAKVNQAMASRADSTQKQITDMDARNNTRFADLGKRIDKVGKQANAGSATALAAAGIPQVLESQTFAMGAATGGYEGEQALAVGFSARVSRSVVVKAAVGTDTQHGTGYNAGVSVGW